MSGEYLPDCDAGEVEIARITIQSTLLDVTAVYARRLLIYDDGRSSDGYFPVNNDNSSIRAGIWLRHQTSPERSIAVSAEGQWVRRASIEFRGKTVPLSTKTMRLGFNC